MISTVAVIGSRSITNLCLEKELSEIIPEHTVKNCVFVSGGAKGVDTLIKQYCKDYGFTLYEFKPINPKDRLSYLFRNVEILTFADKIIAFWDGKSKGTKFVIDYAKARQRDNSENHKVKRCMNLVLIQTQTSTECTKTER
jgi:hypothetical protein